MLGMSFLKDAYSGIICFVQYIFGFGLNVDEANIANLTIVIVYIMRIKDWILADLCVMTFL